MSNHGYEPFKVDLIIGNETLTFDEHSEKRLGGINFHCGQAAPEGTSCQSPFLCHALTKMF